MLLLLLLLWVRDDEEAVREPADLGSRSEPILERRFEFERRVDRAGGRWMVGGEFERGGSAAVGEGGEDARERGEVCGWEGRGVGLVRTVG